MATKRVEYDHTYQWEGKQDRYWYQHSYWVKYIRNNNPSDTTEPKQVGCALGTVTRVSDTRSRHFNRWFADFYGWSRHGGTIKSEPMLSRNDAMRWLEVIERMNRS